MWDRASPPYHRTAVGLGAGCRKLLPAGCRHLQRTRAFSSAAATLTLGIAGPRVGLGLRHIPEPRWDAGLGIRLCRVYSMGGAGATGVGASENQGPLPPNGSSLRIPRMPAGPLCSCPLAPEPPAGYARHVRRLRPQGPFSPCHRAFRVGRGSRPELGICRAASQASPRPLGRSVHTQLFIKRSPIGHGPPGVVRGAGTHLPGPSRDSVPGTASIYCVLEAGGAGGLLNLSPWSPRQIERLLPDPCLHSPGEGSGREVTAGPSPADADQWPALCVPGLGGAHHAHGPVGRDPKPVGGKRAEGVSLLLPRGKAQQPPTQALGSAEGKTQQEGAASLCRPSPAAPALDKKRGRGTQGPFLEDV